MNLTMVVTLLAASAGFIWGYRKPAGYCRMSSEEQQGIANRLSSGVINGVVLGGIGWIIAALLFG